MERRNADQTEKTDQRPSAESHRPWRSSGVECMRDNIMVIPALVLAVAEIVALVVMVRGWRKDRRAEDAD